MFRIPKDRVGVKIGRWIKPHVKLLLSVAFALAENVCMNNIRVAAKVSQELEIYLVPARPL